MDRIWQWVWDRFEARYIWVAFAIGCLAILPVWLGSAFLVVAVEGSDRYIDAAAVTLPVVGMMSYVVVLPGVGRLRLVEQWAAGREVDRARALDATYAWARGTVFRTVEAAAVSIAFLLVVVGAIAGA